MANGHDTPLISVRDVHKSFGRNHVIQGVSLDVHAGETLAIIGISGCGKSTLLRLICGLEPPDAGEVTLEDSNYGFVFQYSALFDSLSVFENVAFSLVEEPDHNGGRRPHLSDEEIQRIVSEKLRLVGLEDTQQMMPNDLSGGMRKRVSFARAIVSNPRIILYDEPTAGLDPIASTVLENYISKLGRELGAASILVTHQHSTIQIADRVCLLHKGVIRWMGSPEEMRVTDNPYARQFFDANLEGPLTPDLV